MINDWLMETIPDNDRYYSLSLKPETEYANPAIEKIERSGYLHILTDPKTNKSLPLGIAPALRSDSNYFSQSNLPKKSSYSMTILCITPLITTFPNRLIQDELMRIKASTSGDIYLFSGKRWEGKEVELLRVLDAFMNVFGFIPKTIEFQTIGWGGSLKDCAFYLVGQRWIYSDSYFRHLLLSKGAYEIQLHKFMKHKVLEEIKLSRYHSMFIVKAKHPFFSLKKKIDLDNLFSLQEFI